MKNALCVSIGVVFAFGALASMPASAATVDFTFGDKLGSAAYGQLTTAGGANGVFGVDVIGITGFVGNNPISKLVADPNSPNPATSADGLFIYDNNYDPGTKSVDNAGLLFDVGATEYNLFNNENGTYYLYPASKGAYGSPDIGEFVTVVPEPSLWAMMLVGFGFVGMAIRQTGGKSRRGGLEPVLAPLDAAGRTPAWLF